MYTLTHIDSTTCELSNLFVEPERRHQGLATLDVYGAIAVARSMGYAHIQVHVPEQYLDWWKQFGFKPCATEIHMVCDL